LAAKGGRKKTIAKCTAAEQGEKEEKRRKVNNISIFPYQTS
jgi:hypothetical protein